MTIPGRTNNVEMVLATARLSGQTPSTHLANLFTKYEAGMSSAELLKNLKAYYDVKFAQADELRQAVPIRVHGDCKYVRLADIPEPWRAQFTAALRGSCCPAFEPDIAYAWDFDAWLSGTWTDRTKPIFNN